MELVLRLSPPGCHSFAAYSQTLHDRFIAPHRACHPVPAPASQSKARLPPAAHAGRGRRMKRLPACAAVPLRLWALLAAGPVLFLLFIVGASVFFNAQGVAPGLIGQKVSGLVTEALVTVLVCLGLLLALHGAQVRAAWSGRALEKAGSSAVVGALAGVVLAIAYIHWLAPLLGVLQRDVGDFVPPGSVLPTVSSQIGLFFVANVVLAPLVEETLYRGVALPVLAARFGWARAVAITCLFFGALHWAGGVWYMLLTGLVAGGLFAGLFCWRRSVVAPLAAHLALNAVEFAHALQLRGGL